MAEKEQSKLLVGQLGLPKLVRLAEVGEAPGEAEPADLLEPALNLAIRVEELELLGLGLR
jgi:hypothetical protein